jgi:DinB superfamily
MNSKKWKQNAIRRMKQGRATTLRLLKSMSSRWINEPKTQGNWSVKDVFVHIIAWEKHGCLRLELIAQGKADQLNLYDGTTAENRYNARAVSKYRKRSLKNILKEAESIRVRLMEALNVLPDDEIHNPDHQVMVSVWLPDYAWMHEAEHRQRIQKWLRKRANL